MKPNGPSQNGFVCGSRGNEAPISSETIIDSEPPDVGCHFVSGPPTAPGGF
jgi:hypothetical protein